MLQLFDFKVGDRHSILNQKSVFVKSITTSRFHHNGVENI